MGTKSIRLNKESRCDIISNIRAAYVKENPEPVITNAFKFEVEKLILELHLAKHKDIIDVYNTVFDKSCFKTTRYVAYRNTQGAHISFEVSDYSDDIECLPNFAGISIDLSQSDLPDALTKILKRSKSESKKLREARAKHSAWTNELSRYMQDVRQVIEGTNTTGQLLAVWPEVEKFLPKGSTDPSRIKLPSVNINTLNRKLGK